VSFFCKIFLTLREIFSVLRVYAKFERMFCSPLVFYLIVATSRGDGDASTGFVNLI